jgi:hypothetical protein
MKATKGTKIACSLCGQVVGSFIKDVPKTSPITSNDVAMDQTLSMPDHLGGRKWSCKKDNTVVAELSGQPIHWRVHTELGWIS